MQAAVTESSLEEVYRQLEGALKGLQDDSHSGNKNPHDEAILRALLKEIRDSLPANESADVVNGSTPNYYDDTFYEYYHSDSFVNYMQLRPPIYCTLLGFLMLVGVLGNALVVMAAWRQTRRASSAFYALVINLAVTSLVFLLICVPFVIYENVLMMHWVAGETMCQLQRYIQQCTLYAIAYGHVLLVGCSVLQLQAPRQIAGVNTGRVGMAFSAGMWLAVILGNVPAYLGHGLHDQIEGVAYCFHKSVHENWDIFKRFIVLHVLLSYALPFLALTLMCLLLFYNLLCTKSARNYGTLAQDGNAGPRRLHQDNATMDVALTLLFAICWSPDKILDLILAHNPHTFGSHVFVMGDLFLVMACCNSTISPWVILFTQRHTLSAHIFTTSQRLSPTNSDVIRTGHQHQNGGHTTGQINGTAGCVTEETSESDVCQFTETMELNPPHPPESIKGALPI